MRWPRWARWLWNLKWNPYLRLNGSRHVVAQFEEKLSRTQAETEVIGFMAERMRRLPVDEFAERVVRAFGKIPS